ncbi:MAG: site-specific integrase [Acidobacteria bacterium]|nr:site-specific integrase [Acidobacteriota bacterium]
MPRKNGQPRDGIYTRKDRPGFWMSYVDAQGRRKQKKLNAANITIAKDLRAAELRKIEHAKALGFTPASDEQFAELAKRFLEYQKPRLSDASFIRETGIVNKQLIPFFNCQVKGIRRQDVQRYITERSAETSAHSVSKELNVLKHALRMAVEWEIIPVNPAQGVKAPKVPAGRVRYLQPTELKALLEACPDWLRPIVALLVCTGMRRSEVLGLRWLDVDVTHKRVILPQTKNGEGRIVYLNELGMMVLASLPAGEPGDKLFGNVTPEQVSVRFARVCVALKIENFRLHDLRHTAASWLRMSGADIHTVALVLGHKDLRMTARYSHLSPDYLADAMGKLDGVFGAYRDHSVTKEKGLTTKKL